MTIHPRIISYRRFITGGSAFARQTLVLILLLLGTAQSHAALPVLITPELPPATLGITYQARLLIGAAPTVTASVMQGLPAGLSATYSGNNISVSGVPTAAGVFGLTLNATNTAGSLSKAISLTVVDTTAFASNVTDISAGSRNTCAVVAGGVQCWGDNAVGQLGNNSTTTSLVPVQTIPPNSGVTTVSSTAFAHSCAVVRGGVQCWGTNGSGQLGNNSTTTSLVPVQAIPANSGVTAVSAGLQHSCALVAGGVKCWGANGFGQLGNTTGGFPADSLVPVQAIPANSGVTAVSAGQKHNCAVVGAGLKCWGSNSMGQFGNDTVSASNTPIQILLVNGAVTAVSAGGEHTCAVIAGGVQCTGSNDAGQLGNNSTTNSRTFVQAIPANSGATTVSAGISQSCAMVAARVMCWGNNSYPQFGNAPASTQSLVPVQILSTNSGVSAVTAGDTHSCALVLGAVQCWGANLWGQLGDGTVPQSLVPGVAFPAGSGVTSVSSGGSNGCAIVSGAVFCWGDNTFGQLGNNSTVPSVVPVQAVGINATAVSVLFQHACAVVSGGVQCWGDNTSGQLGINSTIRSSLVPVQTIPANSGATAVSAGAFHSCVVVANGVQCWGANDNGQLGNNSTIGSRVPVQAIPATSFAYVVSVGQTHTCAIAGLAEAYCWGSNALGELGNNSTTPSLVPTRAIFGTIAVTDISAGNLYTCAVVSGGVQCWGKNNSGQLGNNSTTGSLLPVQTIPANSGVTVVSAGFGGSTCVVVAGGVQCWGANASGQLGNNSTTPSLVPVQIIPANSGVTSVSARSRSACASIDGGAVCWGDNVLGQLTDVSQNFLRIRAAQVIKWLSPLPNILSVLSRKTHGAIGDFDVVIDATQPITGAVSVEPRVIGSGHVIVFQFDGPVDSVASVAAVNGGGAPLAGVTAIPSGNTVAVTLPGVPEISRATISLSNINGGVNVLSASMGFLVGDVNETRSVNSSDISSVKARSGQVTTTLNFRFDVNATGAINSSDISAVKARSGQVLP